MNILKFKKTKADGSGVIRHAESGDPIFNVHRRDSGSYVAEWHPNMIHIYGEDRLNAHAFYGLKGSELIASKQNTFEKNLSKYYDILSSNRKNVDPLETKLVGVDEDRGETTKKYHVISDEGEHVADMHIKHTNDVLSEVGLGVSVHIPPEHLSSWKLYKKDYGGGTETDFGSTYWHPIEALRDVKGWLPNRNRKPSFIGINMHDNVLQYKTHLPDDVAAEKYTNHIAKINKILNRRHTIEKLTPSDYLMTINLSNGNVHEHRVSVKDGIVTHTENRVIGKVHYDAKPYDRIIE